MEEDLNLFSAPLDKSLLPESYRSCGRDLFASNHFHTAPSTSSSEESCNDKRYMRSLFGYSCDAALDVATDEPTGAVAGLPTDRDPTEDDHRPLAPVVRKEESATGMGGASNATSISLADASSSRKSCARIKLERIRNVLGSLNGLNAASAAAKPVLVPHLKDSDSKRVAVGSSALSSVAAEASTHTVIVADAQPDVLRAVTNVTPVIYLSDDDDDDQEPVSKSSKTGCDLDLPTAELAVEIDCWPGISLAPAASSSSPEQPLPSSLCGNRQQRPDEGVAHVANGLPVRAPERHRASPVRNSTKSKGVSSKPPDFYIHCQTWFAQGSHPTTTAGSSLGEPQCPAEICARFCSGCGCSFLATHFRLHSPCFDSKLTGCQLMCRWCSLTFPTVTSLMEHNSPCPSKVKARWCTGCNKYWSGHRFPHHMPCSVDDFRQYCSTCKRRYLSRDFAAHLSSCTKTLASLLCHWCVQLVPEPNFGQHYVTCSKRFKTMVAFELKQGNCFRCADCGLIAESEPALRLHLADGCCGQEGIREFDPGKRAATSIEGPHITGQPSVASLPPQDGGYPCTSCDFIFQSELGLRRHEALNHAFSIFGYLMPRAGGSCLRRLPSSKLVLRLQATRCFAVQAGYRRQTLFCEQCKVNIAVAKRDYASLRASFYLHAISFHDFRPISCECCCRDFATIEEFGVHLEDGACKQYKAQPCQHCGEVILSGMAAEQHGCMTSSSMDTSLDHLLGCLPAGVHPHHLPSGDLPIDQLPNHELIESGGTTPAFFSGQEPPSSVVQPEEIHIGSEEQENGIDEGVDDVRNGCCSSAEADLANQSPLTALSMEDAGLVTLIREISQEHQAACFSGITSIDGQGYLLPETFSCPKCSLPCLGRVDLISHLQAAHLSEKANTIAGDLAGHLLAISSQREATEVVIQCSDEPIWIDLAGGADDTRPLPIQDSSSPGRNGRSSMGEVVECPVCLKMLSKHNLSRHIKLHQQSLDVWSTPPVEAYPLVVPEGSSPWQPSVAPSTISPAGIRSKRGKCLCETCGQEFCSKFSLERHVKNHADRGPLKCLAGLGVV